MEDKIINELNEGVKSIESFMQNLSKFASEITDNLTPEQRAIVDKEVSKIDVSDISSEIDKIKQQFESQMKNFGK